MFENLLTGDVYDDEDKAIESVLEHMDDQDIIDYADPDLLDSSRMLKALAKADAPLFYEIIESAQSRYLEDYLAQWKGEDE